MKKQLSERQYKNYLTVVKNQIASIERGIAKLDKLKEIANMSYPEWLEWQQGVDTSYREQHVSTHGL